MTRLHGTKLTATFLIRTMQATFNELNNLYLTNPNIKIASEEQFLIQALVQGDCSAFWQLWERYKNYLYHHCLRWMDGNSTEAQDALSQIMLKAWEKLSQSARKITNFKGWLTRLAHNFCMDIHRKCNKGLTGIENIEAIAKPQKQSFISQLATPENILERAELQEVINCAINGLPDKLRQVFLWRFEEEKSYQDIAQQLAISYDSVRKRIQRARAILRKRLHQYLRGLDEKAYGEIGCSKKIRKNNNYV